MDRRLFLTSVGAGLIAPRIALAQPAPIPFEIVQGRIVVPVTVNGQPVRAILDSGSAVMGLDAATAAQLGIVATGARRTLRGVQHSLSGRAAQVAEVGIGPMRLAPVEMLVLDYQSLIGPVGYAVEAALGGEFFRRFVVELDFAARTMRLHPREVFAAPNATQVPLSARRGLMTAPVSFPQGMVRAIVDLASEPPLIVSPSPARRLKLLAGRRLSTAPLRGVGGESIARIASAPSLSVGGAAFSDVPFEVTARSLGVEANLGLGLLSRFHLWLDFGGSRMWLSPEGAERPFKRNLLGVYGAPDGEQLRVTHVAAGSPAALAGFRPGERIAAINGQPAAAANVALENASEGTALTFALADGKSRQVVLARYY